MKTLISRSEIGALVSLLDDDNSFVLGKVTARLRELGPAAVPLIREAAIVVREKATRRAGGVLEQIHRDSIMKDLTGLVTTPHFDLEQASFLLAMTRYPELDLPYYTEILDELARDVQDQLDTTGAISPRRVAQIFGSTLFGKNGLSGNLESYYDPDNSYLNRVLDTRKGIPISLCATGLLVAKRLSLPMVGIGMPTHFLLGYDKGNGHVLIDPFNRGAVVTPISCKLRLEQIGITWRDEYLEPVTSRSMLLRMVANLFLVYQQNGDKSQLEILGELANLLQSPSPQSDPG